MVVNSLVKTWGRMALHWFWIIPAPSRPEVHSDHQRDRLLLGCRDDEDKYSLGKVHSHGKSRTSAKYGMWCSEWFGSCGYRAGAGRGGGEGGGGAGGCIWITWICYRDFFSFYLKNLSSTSYHWLGGWFQLNSIYTGTAPPCRQASRLQPITVSMGQRNVIKPSK